MNGRWTCLYRAVDKQGRTVDFQLSERHDVAAAKAFFRKAMKHNGAPRVITLDAYAASHRAVRELKVDGKTAEAGSGPFEQVSQQRGHDQQNRAGSENQEAAIQGRQASRSTKDDSSNLGSRGRSVVPNRRPFYATRGVYYLHQNHLTNVEPRKGAKIFPEPDCPGIITSSPDGVLTCAQCGETVGMVECAGYLTGSREPCSGARKSAGREKKRDRAPATLAGMIYPDMLQGCRLWPHQTGTTIPDATTAADRLP